MSSIKSGNSSDESAITRQDVQHSLHVYSETLKSTSKYYRKFLELSQAAVEFANSLDSIAKCKGAQQLGPGLKAAADLHRLIAKQQDTLAESIHKEFELPLQRNLVSHQKKVDENEKQFDKSMRKMQDEISKTENKMLRGRKKDLNVFQQSLKDMQRQAEELEQLKKENSDRVLVDEQNNLMFFAQKTAGVVKNEYEFFTSLAGLSRDATEEIIGIAFAPPGKTLDAVEKKRMVEKYLSSGHQNASPIVRDSVSIPDSRRQSHASSISSASGQYNIAPSSVKNGYGNLGKNGSSSASGNAGQRPFTPPITPQPTSSSPGASSNTALPKSGSVSSMNPTIQESLKRLNIAASHVNESNGALSGGSSPKISRAASEASVPSLTNNTYSGSSSNENLPQIPNSKPSLDLVVTLHDFTARSDRELSFKKGDVMLVKQRQENWLYSTHHGVPGSQSGWIPVSYTSKYQA